MNTLRRVARSALSVALAMSSTPVWAGTQIQTVSVSATVPSVSSFTLRTTNTDGTVSNSKGVANQVRFDRVDSADQVSGSDAFMYAPYRSQTNSNWHVADIKANGNSLTLSADVSGTVGNKPLAQVLYVWVGGFFETGSKVPISGTATQGDPGEDGKCPADNNSDPDCDDDWWLLDTYQQNLPRAFIGEVPFNYRLNISGIPAGTYTGQITYTLVSN